MHFERNQRKTGMPPVQAPPLPDLDQIYTSGWRERFDDYLTERYGCSDSGRRYWAFSRERAWLKHSRAVPNQIGLVRMISRWMPPQGRRVLVVGSYLGEEAIAYALYGARVVGIDLDGPALELSAGLARRFGVTLDTHVADATASSFADESFDLVSCSQVLGHLPRARQPDLLEEVWRLCKPGGLIWLDTPNQLYWKDKHDTGLPLIHWLPRLIKTRLARRLRRDVSVREPSFGGRTVSLHDYVSYFGLTRMLRRLGPYEILSRYRGFADVAHYAEHRRWEGRSRNPLFRLKLVAMRLWLSGWNWNWFHSIKLAVRKLPCG